MLATELVGRAAAILAVSLLALAPDPSTLLTRSGLFDMTWLVFTAPGSGYAIGLALLATGMLRAWLRAGHVGMLAVAAASILIMILERVHLFMLAAPALLAVGLLGSGAWGRRLVTAGAMAAGAVVAGLSLAAPGAAGNLARLGPASGLSRPRAAAIEGLCHDPRASSGGWPAGDTGQARPSARHEPRC